MTGHVPLLADLVRRPSVNPMGRDVSGPEYLEGRVTDFLVQRFTALGLPWARQPVSPGRDNVVARLDATVPRAPVLLWDAHQDTVPVENMTIEPFVPVIRDGRMYGRGTCDVKGGMAAMIAAVERLLTHPGERSATVVFSATVNEEFGDEGHGGTTTDHLAGSRVRRGRVGGCRLPESGERPGAREAELLVDRRGKDDGG